MGARRPLWCQWYLTFLTSHASDVECAFVLGQQGPPASCVGAHRHPWVVGTRGRCGDSGGRSPSLMEGGDGGSCGGSGGRSSSLVEGGDGGSFSLVSVQRGRRRCPLVVPCAGHIFFLHCH